MPPIWLTIIAWISVCTGAVSAAAIAFDVYVGGRRQRMRIMELVWPITALFLGPLGWRAYSRIGRSLARQTDLASSPEDPAWHGIFISATHCGAGCALGDIIGEWLVFAVGLTIAGVRLWPEYAIDFGLAYIFGILFQYYALKPMTTVRSRQIIRDAVISESLSILAFEAGMFAWMALVYFVFFTKPHLATNHISYWLLMQVAATIGLATSYPVNVWLVRHGIKHSMGRSAMAMIMAPGSHEA